MGAAQTSRVVGALAVAIAVALSAAGVFAVRAASAAPMAAGKASGG